MRDYGIQGQPAPELRVPEWLDNTDGEVKLRADDVESDGASGLRLADVECERATSDATTNYRIGVASTASLVGAASA